MATKKKKTTKKPAKKVSKKATKKSSKKTKKKVVKKTSKKTSKKKTTKKPAKKSSKKTKKKVSKKPIKKVSKKSKKKVSKKPAKKVVKKTSKKKETSKKAPKVLKKKVTSSASETKKERKSSFIQKLERELELIQERASQVTIKGSEGFEYCKRDNCDQPATTEDYCRYHYMALWDLIKERKKLLADNQLKKRIKGLSDEHSVVILNHMLRDFSNEQDFFLALSEMKLPSYSELTSEN